MRGVMRRSTSVVVAAFAVGTVAACAERQPLQPISVLELVNNASAYDGHQVAVHGYVSYGFESCVIYDGSLTGADFQRATVWYWNADCMGRTKDFLVGYATLYGVYHASDKGHLAAYGSALTVDRVVWDEK